MGIAISIDQARIASALTVARLRLFEGVPLRPNLLVSQMLSSRMGLHRSRGRVRHCTAVPIGRTVLGRTRTSLCFREVGTTGYIDSRGQFVIPPRLTYGASFHEDRAAVIISGPCRITNGGSCQRAAFQPTEPRATYDCRYAFIDKRGEPVSDLRFDDAEDFAEGLAPVRIGNQWGFVNRSGQISIPPRFQSAEPFSEGMAVVEEDGKMGFIDHAGNYVIRPQFESAESFSDGRPSFRKVMVRESGTPDSSTRPAIRHFPEYSLPLRHSPTDLHRSRWAEKGTFAWINKSGRPVFTYVVRQTRRTGH